LGDPIGQPKAKGAGGEGWPGSGARLGQPPAGLHGPEGREPPPPAPPRLVRPEGPPRGPQREDPGGVRRAPGPPGRRPHPGGGDRRRGTRGAHAPLPRPSPGLGGTLTPGRGWLLRDLTWERAKPLGKSCPCARLFASATGVRRPSPPEPPPLPSSGAGPSPPPQGESLPFRGRGNPHS
jgi:hypothetical protein